MILKLNNNYELFISTSNKYYLCSCPALLPSFVVRHETADDARDLMLNVVNYILNNHNISYPVKQVGYTAGTKNEFFYRQESPNLFPGLIAYGPSLPTVQHVLNAAIEKYLRHDILQKKTIQLVRSGNEYIATCPLLFPADTIVRPTMEEAYNEMAGMITDHLINEERLQHFDSPVIVTGAFHSGTSAVALLLMRNGISMGNSLNYAYDELEIAHGRPGSYPFGSLGDLIQHYYPDAQSEISMNECILLRHYFFQFLSPKIVLPYWGWKTPTSVFLMPLLSQVFPKARFIHIVRDGRDVALSPHSEFPNNDLGKLMYFDKTDIDEWEGIALTPDLGSGMASNTFDPPPTEKECAFYAYLWQKMSMLGDKYGKTLGERYLQIRFESLCLNSEKTVARISEFLDIPLDANVIEWKKDRVGKFNRPPEWACRDGFIHSLENHCRTGLNFFGYNQHGMPCFTKSLFQT